jgi:DNA-binding MltR family transcriptional regulator
MTPKSRKREERELAVQQSQDLEGFFKEFQSESDRATAILGAALLDEKLRQLLEAFFVDDQEQTRLLLDNEQPIGPFGARIRLSYCLGLLPAEDQVKLVLIKDIRNRFAHQLHGLTFASLGVAAHCEKLRGFLDYPPEVAELYDTPRKVFLSAVSSLSLALWAYVTPTQKRRKVPKWETLIHWRVKPASASE